MALAESMKNFVNDLKASRRSRHQFVKGNKENAKNIMAENRKFLQDIHAQNKARGEQTRAFLKSSKETRMQEYKQTMERIRGDISRIHQAKEAITQGAREMLKEFRSDNQMAHKYWASLTTDEPIEDTETTKSKSAKKENTKDEPSSRGGAGHYAEEIKPETEKKEEEYRKKAQKQED
jgi:hypothetical protein